MTDTVSVDRLDHIPARNTSLAVRAYAVYARVWLWEMASPKDYKCWLCGEIVVKHKPHTMYRFAFRNSYGFQWHHLHNLCAERKVLPQLTGIEIIPLDKVPIKQRTSFA